MDIRGVFEGDRFPRFLKRIKAQVCILCSLKNRPLQACLTQEIIITSELTDISVFIAVYKEDTLTASQTRK